MNVTAFPAMLLFAFSIPIIMQYRILPIEGTPYLLFGITFFLLAAKCFLDLYPNILKQYNRTASLLSLITVLVIVLGGATWTTIIDRHRIAPVWKTHDIILQQEAAMRYLLQGKNPYKETYFNTPVEDFQYDEMGEAAVNPALYHFVMPPLYLIAPFPLYIIANRTLGYFDGRMLSLVAIIGISLFLWFTIKDKVLREIAVIIIALSPATVDYFIEGRSDTFALFWLVGSFYFFSKKKYLLSSILMGCAMVSKQTMWFALPLYLGILGATFAYKTIRKQKGSLSFSQIPMKPVFKNVFYYGAIVCVVAGIITVPFVIWDAKAFLDSVVLYLSAGGKTGYPVSGYGFSMILYSHGIIKQLHDYYPFTLWQLVMGIPVLILGLRWIIYKPVLSRWYLSYAVFLSVIWYFSRYFNNSHIAFLSSLYILGIIFHYDEIKGKQI